MELLLPAAAVAAADGAAPYAARLVQQQVGGLVQQSVALRLRGDVVEVPGQSCLKK